MHQCEVDISSALYIIYVVIFFYIVKIGNDEPLLLEASVRS